MTMKILDAHGNPVQQPAVKVLPPKDNPPVGQVTYSATAAEKKRKWAKNKLTALEQDCAVLGKQLNALTKAHNERIRDSEHAALAATDARVAAVAEVGEAKRRLEEYRDQVRAAEAEVKRLHMLCDAQGALVIEAQENLSRLRIDEDEAHAAAGHVASVDAPKRAQVAKKLEKARTALERHKALNVQWLQDPPESGQAGAEGDSADADERREGRQATQGDHG